MIKPSTDPIAMPQGLSDLMDGEADATGVERACAQWSEDAESRRTWHAYHLIGDVLRSEDLASTARHDAEFFAAFRTRLAAEPVVLAPTPERERMPALRRRLVWAAPMAVAAGFVAVAGVLVVAQLAPQTGDGASSVIAAAAPSPMASAPVPRIQATSAGDMLRDARVDEYLRAHRATFAGSPSALPGGAMRNVDLMVPQR